MAERRPELHEVVARARPRQVPLHERIATRLREYPAFQARALEEQNQPPPGLDDADILRRTGQILNPRGKSEALRANVEARKEQFAGAASPAAERPKRMSHREGAEKLSKFLRTLDEETREMWLTTLEDSRGASGALSYDEYELPESTWTDEESIDPSTLDDNDDYEPAW